MSQHLKIKLCRHPHTPTGRLGRGPILTFHSRILPYLGASGCGFLVACLGRRCSRSSQRVLGISSEPLLSPSPRDPLVPGVPPAPPSIGLARPAPPAKRPCARIPVQCSPPRPLQSVHSYPQPQSIRLTSTPASRLLPLPPLQQPQPGRERVSERAREGGGGSPLRSAHPLLSGRSALPLLSRPLPCAQLCCRTRCPRPSRPAQGSHACQARVTQATGWGTTRASSLLLPTRTSWGYPLPKSRAPPANGHRGSWQRQGVG